MMKPHFSPWRISVSSLSSALSFNNIAVMVFLLFIFGVERSAHGQNENGFRLGVDPLSTYSHFQIDSVNLENGNVFINIPLYSLPQLGSQSLSFSAIANTNIFREKTTCTDATDVNCHLSYISNAPAVVLPPGSFVAFKVGPTIVWNSLPALSAQTVQTTEEAGQEYADFVQYYVTDYTGTAHPLRYDATNSSQLRTTDGSGYLFVSTSAQPYNFSTYALTGTLYDSLGRKAHVQAGVSGSISDTDGNTIAINGSSLTDTLGRPPIPIPSDITPQSSVQGCPNLEDPSQPATSSYDWIVPGPDGGNATYLICNTVVNIQTNFWGYGECNYVTSPLKNPNDVQNGQAVYQEACFSANVIQSIVLPDKSYYGFSYSTSTSGSTAYGDLTKIVLPTGGSISYGYTNLTAQDTHDPVTGEPYYIRTVTSRTVDDGNGHTYPWSYQYQNLVGQPNQPSGVQYSITETDPNLNDTVHYFTQAGTDSHFESDTKYYQGHSSSGTLLKTVHNSYQVTTAPGVPLSFGSGIGNLLLTTSQATYGSAIASNTTGYDQGFTAIAPYCLVGTGGVQCSQPTSPISLSLGITTSQSTTDFSGTTLNSTNTAYYWQSNNSYKQANLLSTPCLISVYGPGSTSTASGCTLSTTPASNLISQRAIGYDENNGSPQGVYGHKTSTTSWLNTGLPVKSQTIYNSEGMPTQQIDPLQRATQIIYESSGLFPKEIDSPSTSGVQHKDLYTYDDNLGVPLSHTDQNGVLTQYQHDDPLGRLSLVIAAKSTPAESWTSYDYPSANEMDVAQDQNTKGDGSEKRKTIVDGLGRIIQQVDPASNIIDTTYDGLNRVQSVSNPYHSTGDSSYGITSYSHDSLGRVTYQCQPDNTSSPTTTCTPSSSYLQWTYTGSVVDFYDETKRHWQRTSDALGRLTKVLEPDGTSNLTATPTLETDYQYDAANNLTQVNQHGLVRKFTYDSLSRLVCASNPESATAACPSTATGSYPAGATSYSYDADGNVISKISPAPNSAWGSGATVTTTYQYDALNRLTYELAVASTAPNTFTHYFYYDQTSLFGITFANPIGNLTLTTASFSGSPQTVASTTMYWNHDAMGRVLGMKTCTPATCDSTNIADSTWYDLSNTYDLAGNTISYTDGFGTTISPHYDGAGRLSSVTSSKDDVTHPETLWTANSYGPVGPTQVTFGNGLVDMLQYTKRMRLQSSNTTNASGQTTMYSEGLIYYPNGSLHTVTDSINGNWTYVYDNLNRISTAVSANTGQGCQFAYDSFGNRTQQTGYQGSCSSEFLTFSTPTNHIDGFCYDAAGNLLNAGGCAPSGMHNQNLYDAYGNLLTGNYNSSNLTSYTVDSLGHRVAKYQGGAIERMYLYGVDGNPVAEMDGAGNWLQTNVRAGGQFIAEYQGADTYFQHVDHLGTIRAQTRSDGTLWMTCTNQPFGDMLACNGTSNPPGYHFTGKERDAESGLDYFGARYYASSMGRFMSPDFNGDPEPVPYADLENPQTLNLYSYVQNNPLTKRDFDGHASWQNCSDGSGSQCWTGDYNGEYNNGLFWNGQSNQWQQNDPNPQPDSPAGEFFTGLTRTMIANTGSDFGYGVRQMTTGMAEDFFTGGAKSLAALFPPVKFLHGKDLLEQNSNIDSVRKMSTQQIIDSLKPGQPDSLKAKADGTIMDGNTRLRVLEERGVDINSLPRELYSSEPVAPWEEPGGGEGPIIP